MITVTKKDLVELGYGNSFATEIIRECKKLMIEKGHIYYQSRKLDRVPVSYTHLDVYKRQVTLPKVSCCLIKYLALAPPIFSVVNAMTTVIIRTNIVKGILFISIAVSIAIIVTIAEIN